MSGYPHNSSYQRGVAMASTSNDPRLRQRSQSAADHQQGTGPPQNKRSSAWHTDSFSTRPVASSYSNSQSQSVGKVGFSSSPTKLPPRLLKSLEDLIQSEPFEQEEPVAVERQSSATSTQAANYCSACNKAFRIREYYEQHIMSMEHIANMKEQREKEMQAAEPKMQYSYSEVQYETEPSGDSSHYHQGGYQVRSVLQPRSI